MLSYDLGERQSHPYGLRPPSGSSLFRRALFCPRYVWKCPQPQRLCCDQSIARHLRWTEQIRSIYITYSARGTRSSAHNTIAGVQLAAHSRTCLGQRQAAIDPCPARPAIHEAASRLLLRLTARASRPRWRGGPRKIPAGSPAAGEASLRFPIARGVVTTGRGAFGRPPGYVSAGLGCGLSACIGRCPSGRWSSCRSRACCDRVVIRKDSEPLSKLAAPTPQERSANVGAVLCYSIA